MQIAKSYGVKNTLNKNLTTAMRRQKNARNVNGYIINMFEFIYQNDMNPSMIEENDSIHLLMEITAKIYSLRIYLRNYTYSDYYLLKVRHAFGMLYSKLTSTKFKSQYLRQSAVRELVYLHKGLES
jgi:hypothetical protein